MTKLSRDRATRDVEETHDLRMAVRRLKIADADTEQESRTAFLEAVLSLPGVSADPVTVQDVTVLTDTFIARRSAVPVLSLPEAVPTVLMEVAGGQDIEGLSGRTPPEDTGDCPDPQSVRWTVSGG